MRTCPACFRTAVCLLMMGLAVLLVGPSAPAWAQEEVTSNIYRYRERVSTGYYEGYEVSPRRVRAVLQVPGLGPNPLPFGSSSAAVRIRTRLPDAHRGLKFYYRSTCIECHPREARNIHSVRAGITCRQCHGPEPIPSIDNYFAATNPIRRHAYICAKCHEGANSSFGTFYVHEPPSTALSTRESFPLLFYTSWGMLILLLGTLAFFVPHSLMVGARELSGKLPVSLLHRFMAAFQAVFKNAFVKFHRFIMSLLKIFEKKKTPENKVDPEDAA